MHEFSSPHKLKNTGRQGFALIVVLSALLVLTTLFAITQTRSMTTLQASALERLLLSQSQRDEDLLRLAIAYRLASPDDTQFEVPEGQLILQDVGGLIDLNTAAPELLDRLASGLGISNERMTAFRDWRRVPHRTLSTNDFARLTGIAPVDRARLMQLTTVFSGRSGIAPDFAPDSVWSVIGSSADSLPPELKSEPAYTVFAVWHKNHEASAHIGTISIGPTMLGSRILHRN